jgi:hypothetical protein
MISVPTAFWGRPLTQQLTMEDWDMMRSRLTALVISLGAALAFSGAAFALATGSYNLTLETTMTAPNCRWVGGGSFVQNGTSLSGDAFLTLDETTVTDPLCVAAFPTLSGSLTGTLIGTAIDLTGSLGPFTAHFIGTTIDQGLTATGTWTATVGRLRVRGVFAADRDFSPAPALSSFGLSLLSLVLFGVGAWFMRRPQRASALASPDR